MQILKLGAVTALGALLAMPAMAYISQPNHGPGNFQGRSASSGGPTWTWPVPLRHSESGTAMNTGSGGTTWTWPAPLPRSESMTAMNPGPGAPRAAE